MFTTMASQIYELAFGTEYYQLRVKSRLVAPGRRPVRGDQLEARHGIFGGSPVPMRFHLRCCGLRSSLTHQRMRSLRCSAAP